MLVLERRQIKQCQRELIHLLVVDLHPILLRDIASRRGLSSARSCGTEVVAIGQKEGPAELSSPNAPAARLDHSRLSVFNIIGRVAHSSRAAKYRKTRRRDT